MLTRIPVAIAASPTVEDALVERIERDDTLSPQEKIAAFIRGRQIIAEQGIEQI